MKETVCGFCKKEFKKPNRLRFHQKKTGGICWYKEDLGTEGPPWACSFHPTESIFQHKTNLIRHLLKEHKPGPIIDKGLRVDRAVQKRSGQSYQREYFDILLRKMAREVVMGKN
jgi:hypothetical protein